MTFLDLYGTELTRELGSADTVLFTTARRKAAINAGQLEFMERTDCLPRQMSVTLTTGTQEYDLDTSISDFASLSEQGVSIKIVSGTTTRYLEGDDLRVTTVARLDQEESGWRAVSAATPLTVYLRRDGGAVKLGFHPKPSITAGDVWTALVGSDAIPDDLSADTDEPFTVTGNPIRSLRPFHRALVHFGAYDCEKYRKDTAKGALQLQLFEAYVARYLMRRKPKGGQSVRFVRNYRRRSERRDDPRISP